MAVKTMKHWGWGMFRATFSGTIDAASVALGAGAIQFVGIDIPNLTLKQFLVVLGVSAARSMIRYAKENPLPDIDETP